MRDSPSTDADFTAFVAACSPTLYRSAWLLTTSAPAAEDLVQSALAKAYVYCRKVRAADDQVAYVHGIVLKTFLSIRRRRSSGEIPVDVTPDRPSSDRDPTERLALMAALRELPPVDRAVVVLRYWEDCPTNLSSRALCEELRTPEARVIGHRSSITSGLVTTLAVVLRQTPARSMPPPTTPCTPSSPALQGRPHPSPSTRSRTSSATPPG